MAEPMGFFTDPTVCIGCKACEVACKQWNQLPASDGDSLVDTLDETERRLILRALASCNDNIADAAKLLKTDRANLYRRMRRLGIERV